VARTEDFSMASNTNSSKLVAGIGVFAAVLAFGLAALIYALV
jgi:hypothetical protein